MGVGRFATGRVPGVLRCVARGAKKGGAGSNGIPALFENDQTCVAPRADPQPRVSATVGVWEQSMVKHVLGLPLSDRHVEFKLSRRKGTLYRNLGRVKVERIWRWQSTAPVKRTEVANTAEHKRSKRKAT